jgi:hypothetical protein
MLHILDTHLPLYIHTILTMTVLFIA